MTNTLDFKKMENIGGGRGVTYFCAGFGMVATTYGAGLLLNWWNPIGQTATVAAALIGVACAAHELYHL